MKANLQYASLQDADLAGANLHEANFGSFISFLTTTGSAEAAIDARCGKLTVAKNWQLAYRDETLACGAPIPVPGQ